MTPPHAAGAAAAFGGPDSAGPGAGGPSFSRRGSAAIPETPLRPPYLGARTPLLPPGFTPSPSPAVSPPLPRTMVFGTGGHGSAQALSPVDYASRHAAAADGSHLAWATHDFGGGAASTAGAAGAGLGPAQLRQFGALPGGRGGEQLSPQARAPRAPICRTHAAASAPFAPFGALSPPDGVSCVW